MRLGFIVGTPDLLQPSFMILDGPDLEGNLRQAADWGYDGVELGIRDPALLDSGQIREWINRYDLELVGLCTGEVWGQEGLGIAGLQPQQPAAGAP